MVKILETINAERRKTYYRIKCPYCSTYLAFERGDIWIDDPVNYIGRIECVSPKCRMKVHLRLPVVKIENAVEITKEEYDNANADASKSGLQMLMDEKKTLDQQFKNDLKKDISEMSVKEAQLKLQECYEK